MAQRLQEFLHLPARSILLMELRLELLDREAPARILIAAKPPMPLASQRTTRERSSSRQERRRKTANGMRSKRSAKS